MYINGHAKNHYVECCNRECGKMFNVKDPEAKPVGFLRFCKEACWQAYQQARELSSAREQR